MVHRIPWHKIARTPMLIRAKIFAKTLGLKCSSCCRKENKKQKTKNSASSVFSDPSSCFQNYKATTPTIDAAHTLTTVQATLNKLSSKLRDRRLPR